MIIQQLLNVNTSKQETRHFQITSPSSSENKGDKMRFTQSVRNLNKLLDMQSLKKLDNYSSFKPSPLTIQNFIDFGRNETAEQMSFTFLRQEIPVRLSNIMKEINLLPGNLLCMPSVVILQDWYSQSLMIRLCSSSVRLSRQSRLVTQTSFRQWLRGFWS